MGVCILGMGECGTSSTTTNNMTTKTVNEILTNMVSTTSQTVNATTISLQNAKIKLGDIKKCKDVGNLTQTINNTQEIKITLDLTSTQSLQEQISNALKNAITTSNDQEQGFLSTASTSTNTYNNINDYIDNVTSTNITNSTVQDLKLIMSNAQKGNITLGDIICKGDGKPDNIGNLAQSMFVSQIVEVLLKAIVGQEAVTNLQNSTDNTENTENKQENSGLGGVLNNLLKLLGGGMIAYFILMMCPCIVLICCCCICCKKKK